MKAEIKRLYSPDINDLETFIPVDNEFCFLLQIMIGVKDKIGEESFDIIVCTPQYLIKNHEEEVVFGSNYLIVFEYDYKKILTRLRAYVEHLEGENWDELARKISKIAKWEFEDYH